MRIRAICGSFRRRVFQQEISVRICEIRGRFLIGVLSGGVHLRQVHLLEGSQNPLLICCPPIQAVIWLGDRLADTPLRGKSASPYSVHNVRVAPLLGDMVDIFTYRCLVIEYTLSALKYNNKV